MPFTGACPSWLGGLLCLTREPLLRDDEGLETQTPARLHMQQQTQQSLAAQSILTLCCPRPRQLHVTSGFVWVTQSHDGYDHFLRAGESMLLQGQCCVIEALQDSHLQWDAPGALAGLKKRQISLIARTAAHWRLCLSTHVTGLFQRPFNG